MGISAQELRIGNYILDETGLITIIVAIDSERKFWHETMQKEFKATARLIMLYNFDWNTSYDCWVEKLKPIPLTEEWLLKFNFEIEEIHAGLSEADFGHNPITQDFILTIKNTGSGWFYRNSHFKLNYVHQLQNLIFILSGIDLKLNN